jgi:hypothetical protein
MLSTWRGEEKVAAAEKAAAWHAAKKAADAEALIERRQKFAETKKQAESNSQDGSASGRWRQGQVQIKLGLMYAKGDGVDQDKGEAAKWFRRAKFHLLNEEMRLLISATLTDQTFELALSDATPIVKQKANEWFNPDSWQSRETSAPDFAPESGKVDVPDENLAKVYSLIGLLLLDEDKEKEDLKESLEWFGKAEKAELDRNKAVETNEKLRKKWEDYVRNVPDPFRVPGKVPGKSKSKPILPGGPLHPPTSIKIPKPNLPPSLIRRVPRIPIRNRPAPVPRR